MQSWLKTVQNTLSKDFSKSSTEVKGCSHSPFRSGLAVFLFSPFNKLNLKLCYNPSLAHTCAFLSSSPTLKPLYFLCKALLMEYFLLRQWKCEKRWRTKAFWARGMNGGTILAALPMDECLSMGLEPRFGTNLLLCPFFFSSRVT